MKKLLCALAITAIAAPGLAFADGGTSCAAAQEIFSDQSYSGDTSTSTSFIGSFGALPSPGPDVAFKFTAHNAGNPNDHIAMTVAGWNAGAIITTTCAAAAGNPVQAATGTGSFNVPLTGLTDGTLYYFIVTGNPNDNSGPSGAFNFTNGTTPVTLQDFSID
jgi:hypothetical protein